MVWKSLVLLERKDCASANTYSVGIFSACLQLWGTSGQAGGIDKMPTFTVCNQPKRDGNGHMFSGESKVRG
eukprot:9474523-Pyramimonas_sp.AAC.2